MKRKSGSIILVCFLIAVFLSGCNKSAYDKLSDQDKTIVDSVLSNSSVWERSGIDQINFTSTLFIVRVLRSHQSDTSIYHSYYYSLDGSTLESEKDEIFGYSFLSDEQKASAREPGYSIDWSIEEKREALAKELSKR